MEKKAWVAQALARALPWAAKGLAGLGRGAAAAKGVAGGALSRMGGASQYLGKGLSQGVTQSGNLARSPLLKFPAAAGRGGLRGSLGGLMQRGGAAMSRGGQAMTAASKAHPGYMKSLGGMQPAVRNLQARLGNTAVGGLGRSINRGALAAAAGAGLYGAGHLSGARQSLKRPQVNRDDLNLPDMTRGRGNFGHWFNQALQADR